jgi:hypothetical protein
MKPLYQELAQLVAARLRCLADVNPWAEKHEQRIMNLVSEYMPSGSGFDNGTLLDWELSNGNKLVFTTSYHHMNDTGMYDGWTEHDVIVKPDLQFGFELCISGHNRNDIKDYIAEAFEYALRTEV